MTDADAALTVAATIARTFALSRDAEISGSHSLLRDEVYCHLRSSILQGVLMPGMRLRDQEIAQALGVSRTPVREAIRRLQDEGLVVAEASRWTKVAPVKTDEAGNLYSIIGALERLAVTQSGPWTAGMLAELAAASNRLAAAIASHDPAESSRADSEFHRILVRASGNQQLDVLVRDLKVRLDRFEFLYFGGASTAKRSVEEHEHVVVALTAGDTGRASQAVEENWRASLKRMHERLHGTADGHE